MAQSLKPEIREKIIETSKEILLEKDFLTLSLREIAKNSGVSLSNIYNYYENKDALIEGIVADTLEEFEAAKLKTKQTLKDKKKLLYLNFDKSKTYAKVIVEFILKHKTNLYILSHKAKGSKLDGYIDNWANDYAQLEYESLRLKTKDHKDLLKHLPSEFFIQNLCSFFFTSVKKLVSQDLDEKSLKKYLEEIFAFIYQGWDYYSEV